MRHRALAAIAIAFTTATTGCSTNQLLDLAMNGSSHATSHQGLRVGSRMVLAGDMHCHVLPPDAPHHVARGLAETFALAKSESLDFVVLTPHVPSRFFMNDEIRGWVTTTQQQLRARVTELHPDMLVIPGFEYTDHRFGHVGAAFADPSEVLAGLTAAEAVATPERFFEMFVQRGGILTINHPVNRALKDPPFLELRYDLSWRAFGGGIVPREIAWITAHAQSLETFNETATHLRDKFILDDEDRSLREASHLADQIARHQRRRFAAVGGSDSHGQWLRATTFVLAKERSIEGVREAVASARTCVRGPEACSLEVRLAGGDRAWLGVGDAINTGESGGMVPFEGRATGDDTSFVVNGTIVASAESGKTATFLVPTGQCAVVRAIVGRSWSSGIYINCF
jgi:hypothetical protein